MTNNEPFEDILRVIRQQNRNDNSGTQESQGCEDSDAPYDVKSFGAITTWLALIQGKAQVSIKEAHICILASSYEGFEQNEEVADFVKNAARGQTAVNKLCVDDGIGLRVLEMAPEMPHQPGPGWSVVDCTKAAAFGMEAAASGGDILGLTSIASGNVAGNIAIVATCHPDGAERWLAAVPIELRDDNYIDACGLIETYEAHITHPLHALRIFGGREIAASLGAFVAARSRGVGVVFDGWAAIAAFCVLEAIQKGSCFHARLASVDSELQLFAAEMAELNRLVGIFVDTGPGCGAALSVAILKRACEI